MSTPRHYSCVLALGLYALLLSFCPSQSSGIEVPNILDESRHERPKRFFHFGASKDSDDENTLPTTYLGEVNLDTWPECEAHLELAILKCQKSYHEHLYERILTRFWSRRRLTTKQAVKELIYTTTLHNEDEEEMGKKPLPRLQDLQYDRNSDYIKHASCCGMWKARECVIQAIEKLSPSQLKDCPQHLVQQYRALPVEKSIKEDVLDYCSEFGEKAPICQVPWNTATPASLPVVVIFLAALIALFVPTYF